MRIKINQVSCSHKKKQIVKNFCHCDNSVSLTWFERDGPDFKQKLTIVKKFLLK